MSNTIAELATETCEEQYSDESFYFRLSDQELNSMLDTLAGIYESSETIVEVK